MPVGLFCCAHLPRITTAKGEAADTGANGPAANNIIPRALELLVHVRPSLDK